MEALLTLLHSEKIESDFRTDADNPRTPAAEAMRNQIQQSMNKE
jgi:hypothetical protein